MYRRDLEGLLASNNFPNFFLLFGADEYQIELFSKEILNTYKDKNSNFLSLYFDEYDFDRARSHIAEASLFGDENTLHIKTDKKIQAKELKELVEICKKNINNKFLLEFYESDTRITTEISRSFGTNFARFFKPSSPDEAIMLLSKSASKIGLNITKNALYEIYSIHNENLYLAGAELNKLANLNTHIEQDTVRKLVFGLSAVSFDDFFNNFINLKDIRKDLYSMQEDINFNEIAFLNTFYRAFLRLFKLYTYIKINGKFDIKEALGYAPPANVANTLKQQSLSINLYSYEKILKSINLAELKLKTESKIDKSAYLVSFILNLQNLISTEKFK